MPTECFSELLAVAMPGSSFTFENYDLSAAETIVLFLTQRLDKAHVSLITVEFGNIDIDYKMYLFYVYFNLYRLQTVV